MTKSTKRVTRRAIDPGSLVAETRDDGSGATVIFLGTVRNSSEVGRVDRIVYESYAPMAEKRLEEIEREVKRIWPVNAVKIVHRVGKLKIGEVSVAVAVSAPHRGEAFDACRHAIERIKHDVPIWKKERLADGREVWVEGNRMRQGREG